MDRRGVIRLRVGIKGIAVAVLYLCISDEPFNCILEVDHL